jgi:predicted transcriptional regulator
VLNQLITSKTRLRLLLKFFVSQANRGYLNGLASEFNESTNSIRKELNHLSEAGYLEKYKDNHKVAYKANIKHPMFEILQKVVYKHLGLEDIVDHVLNQMGEVKQIHLIGDYAKGLDSGQIEVLLVGNDLNNSYITSLEKKIQGIIERKVKFYIANKAIESLPSIVLFRK